MGVARLSRPSDDGADPFVSLCRIGLRLEQGLGELVWELSTLGLGAPSLGRVIESVWALAWGHLIIYSTTPF